MTDRALELGDCLCQLREDVLVSYLCSLEGAKLTRADLTAFLSASGTCAPPPFAPLRTERAGNLWGNGGNAGKKIDKRAIDRHNRYVGDLLRESDYNVGVGHMLGGLAAEISALLARRA